MSAKSPSKALTAPSGKSVSDIVTFAAFSISAIKAWSDKATSVSKESADSVSEHEVSNKADKINAVIEKNKTLDFKILFRFNFRNKK